MIISNKANSIYKQMIKNLLFKDKVKFKDIFI